MIEVFTRIAAMLFTLLLILVAVVSIASLLSFIVDVFTEHTNNKK